MHARFLSLLAVLFVALTASAWADLEIKKARYGTTNKYVDVEHILEAYVRANTLSIPVNTRTMKADPNPRGKDYLFVVYRLDGREYTDTVEEGDVFTFKGLSNVRPIRPPLPFLKPSIPSIEQITVINRSGLPVRVYNIDRYNKWNWAANVRNGEKINLNAQIGQEWVAVDNASNVLARERISPDRNVLLVEPPYTPPSRPPYPGGGFQGGNQRVKFENSGGRTVYVYNLDRWGNWTWKASLEPRGSYSASADLGETWILTDRSNRVIRQVVIDRGMSTVRVD